MTDVDQSRQIIVTSVTSLLKLTFKFTTRSLSLFFSAIDNNQHVIGIFYTRHLSSLTFNQLTVAVPGNFYLCKH